MKKKLLVFALVFGFALFMLACPHVKAVEGGVHVDTQNCHENAASAGNRERTILDCVSGGDVMVRVELARSAWDALHALDAGSSDSGDVSTEATRILYIDGSHCKEDPRDSTLGENALLDCLVGTTTYLVYVGRQEWRAIKARTKPAPFEAGPGK